MARIIARALVLGLLSLVLVGCSALRLAYNQAPSLSYWWIDGYADLNEAQTGQMRRDIDAFFADLVGREPTLPPHLKDTKA